MNKSCVYSIKCKVGRTEKKYKKLILNFFKWYHCPENAHQVFLTHNLIIMKRGQKISKV